MGVRVGGWGLEAEASVETRFRRLGKGYTLTVTLRAAGNLNRLHKEEIQPLGPLPPPPTHMERMKDLHEVSD